MYFYKHARALRIREYRPIRMETICFSVSV